MDNQNIIEVKDLHVDISMLEGTLTPVRGVSFGIEFVGFSYYAETDVREAHYTLLVETPSDIPTTRKKEMEEVFDEKMKQANEKYEKYRSWGMLFDPEIIQLKDGAYQRYTEMLVSQGRVLNQIKPVTVINTPEKKAFFFSQRMDNENL